MEDKKQKELYFFAGDSGSVWSSTMTRDEVIRSSFLNQKEWTLFKILATEEIELKVEFVSKSK